MRKIVFASGKGGAGKTGISTSFFKTYHDKTIMVDCDVDASNCYITLNSKIEEKNPFYSGYKYSIDKETCINCGNCIKTCQFNAIKYSDKELIINGFLCEGCGACLDVCKNNSIKETVNNCGDIFTASSFNKNDFFYARLYPGEDNSGKLITELKKNALDHAKSNNIETIIYDAPPGIGCPVIATLTGVDTLVVVIESTKAGFTDALKLLELVKDKTLNKYLIINKSGVDEENELNILKQIKNYNIKYLGSIPYSKDFYDLLNQKKFMVDVEDEDLRKNILEILQRIK